MRLVLYIFLLGVISYCVLVENAFAYDTQVTIENGTSNHCRPDLSCYRPFQVDILVGDTVTWKNQDNKTHTVTTGTSNYGPVGTFDSGNISPGNSFTQFFGTVGKYQYYDKSDMWSSGLIIVSKTSPHAELGWVNGSLNISKENYTKNGIVISKQIQNSGSIDANSIMFSLKIRNQSGYLMYNNMIKLDIPAKQTIPVRFSWDNPTGGNYNLFFETNAANTIGDMNANNDVSLDLITIPESPQKQMPHITQKNVTLSNFTNPNYASSAVPEFGTASHLILLLSVISVILFLNRKTSLSK